MPTTCVSCGRVRDVNFNLNNWQRHVNACKKRKSSKNKSVDFIETRLINTSKQQLAKMRSDKKYEEMVKEAKQFANHHNLTEVDFKESRKHTKKILRGERASNKVQTSSFDKYRYHTYFTVLDKVITSIQSRFNDSNNISKDFTLLSPERLRKFKNENQHLPQDSFADLVAWLPEIDINELRNEYIIFSKSFYDLTSGIDLPTLLHCPESISSSESCEEEKNITQDEQINMTKIGVLLFIHFQV